MATQILPTGIKNFGSTTIDNIVLDTSGGVDIDNGHLVVTHGGNVTVDSTLQVNSTLNATGNVTLGGTLTVTGSVIFNGASLGLNSNLDLTGNSTFTGDVEITGDLTVDTDTLFVDSTNNRVGIGTTSPQRALVVSDAGAEGFEFYPGSSDTGNTLNHYDRVSSSFIDILTNADQHIFGRADGEKMRLDSSGRLLVGTSSASTFRTNIVPKIQTETTSATQNGISLFANVNSASAPFLVLGKSRGTAIGSNTVVQDDDGLGTLLFIGADGTDRASTGASISARVDGDPDPNNDGQAENGMPGRLVFSTTPAGATVPTDRLLIDSAGIVYFGNFDNVASAGYIEKITSGDYELNIVASRSGAVSRDIVFKGRIDDEAMRINSDGCVLINTTNRDTNAQLVATSSSIGNSNSGITLFDLGASKRVFIARGFILGYGTDNYKYSFEITGVTNINVTELHVTNLGGITGQAPAFATSSGAVTVNTGVYNSYTHLTMLEWVDSAYDA